MPGHRAFPLRVAIAGAHSDDGSVHPDAPTSGSGVRDVRGALGVSSIRGDRDATVEAGRVGQQLLGRQTVVERQGQQLGPGQVTGPGITVDPHESPVGSMEGSQQPLDSASSEHGAAAVDQDRLRRGDGAVQLACGARGITVDDSRQGVASGHASRIVTTSVGGMNAPSTDPAAGDTPFGRVPGPDSDRRAHLDLTGEGWTLTSPWRRDLRGSWRSPEGLEEGLARLDDVHALLVDAEPTGPSPDAATTGALATFVTRAIARGTFVVGDLPAVVSRRVHAGVPGAVHARPGDLAFDLPAVRQRRQVLAPQVTHGLAPTVSILLATRRPHLLDAIVAMIRAQTYRSVELVIAVHGGDPDDLPRPDVGDLGLQVLAAPADRSLGHALSLAADTAGGDLLTKMDDDDHYGPDHLLDLVIGRHVSGAPVVGKSSTVVHLESLDTTVRRVIGTPESLVHRVAGGTILVGADELRALGGWADVPRAVDSALMGAATAAGAAIYRPHDIGYVYVRSAGEGHTWSADAGHFLANVREQWLGLLSHPDFGT